MPEKAKQNRVVLAIQLSKRAFGKYKWQIVILTILGFVSGILEGIGINALIPLFSFVLGEGEGGDDFVSQLIEQFFGAMNIRLSITYLLAFIIAAFLLKAVFTIFLEYIKIKITADYEEQTRNSLLDKILKADWPHLLQQKIGYLETVMMIDITASANLLRQISTGITIITGLFIYLLIAVNISFQITLITLVLGLIFLLAIKPLIYKTKIASFERTNLIKQTAHFVNENILGIKTVKSMMVESGVRAKGEEYFSRLKKLWIRVAMLEQISTSFVQPLSVIFISLIFAFSYKSANFNFGSIAAVMYLIHRIFVYIQQLQRTWHKFNTIFPHLKKTLDYEDAATKNLEENAGSKKFNFKKELVFQNVHFSYSDDRQVLSGVDFTLHKGKMLGLIGPSGGGKTTLVDIILRLLRPKKGEVLLDGEEISGIEMNEWRKNIGYVSQDIFLMNDTIANNIRFYDSSITEKEMEHAAKMANIYDHVMELPEKYNTVIGERGVMLSAGQRQRIAIARVLARNPKILVLDEATSALDNHSEKEIQKVINNLKGKVTILAIAHRLSTVRDSDAMIVLEGGKIIEKGDPKNLLRDKDSYFFKAYNIRD